MMAKRFILIILALISLSKANYVEDIEAKLKIRNEIQNKVIEQGYDPKGLIILGGRQYYISDNVFLSAIEAITLCSDLNMVLTGIESATENDYLIQHLISIGATEGYWTSGNRYYNSWIWSSTGTIFAYEYWGLNEPTEFGTNDVCVILRQNGWFDEPCTAQGLFICEEKTYQ